MKLKSKYFVLSLTLLFLTPFEGTAGDLKLSLDEEPRVWTEIGGYLFATDINGDAEIGPVKTELDVSFSDIVKNLDFGVMAYIEHMNGNWIFIADTAYMNLTVDNTIASNGMASVGLDAEATQLILESFVGYRVLDEEINPNSNASLDLFVGARYNYVNVDVGIEASGVGLVTSASRDRSYNWVDPLIGARIRYNFLENWGMMAIADIGGFGVGSEITWQLGAFINYSFSNGVRLYGGGRYLHFEYEDGSNVGDFKFDADYLGPMIGLAYRF